MHSSTEILIVVTRYYLNLLLAPSFTGFPLLFFCFLILKKGKALFSCLIETVSNQPLHAPHNQATGLSYWFLHRFNWQFSLSRGN